jgi:hypothetical protein
MNWPTLSKCAILHPTLGAWVTGTVMAEHNASICNRDTSLKMKLNNAHQMAKDATAKKMLEIDNAGMLHMSEQLKKKPTKCSWR